MRWSPAPYPLLDDARAHPHRERTRVYSSVCFAEMVLHHVVALDAVLAGIFAVLAPGGFFVIREHDAFEDDFGVVIDMQHGFFARVFDEKLQWDGFCDVCGGKMRRMIGLHRGQLPERGGLLGVHLWSLVTASGRGARVASGGGVGYQRWSHTHVTVVWREIVAVVSVVFVANVLFRCRCWGWWSRLYYRCGLQEYYATYHSREEWTRKIEAVRPSPRASRPQAPGHVGRASEHTCTRHHSPPSNPPPTRRSISGVVAACTNCTNRTHPVPLQPQRTRTHTHTYTHTHRR